MKYDIKITAILLSFFVISQLFGLILVNGSINEVQFMKGEDEIVNITIEHKETPVGRPETRGVSSFLYIILGVVIATMLILVIIKLNLHRIWKAWFFLAVWITSTVALDVYLSAALAALIALGLGIIKIFRPEPIIHNITEVLIYSGIAVLFVPIFEHGVLWMFLLLFVISVYDIIAVRKTRHMVKMAMFLNKTSVFAGLSYPVKHIKKAKQKGIKRASEIKVAVLGGGDIAFPLLFSGVVMENMILSGFPKLMAFSYTLIITFFVTLSLLALFIIAKKDKFYPAMPFLTIGCIIGYIVLLLLL